MTVVKEKIEEENVKRPFNKSHIQTHIMKSTGVDYDTARIMFDSFLSLCERELSPEGSGKITIPGLFTCSVHARVKTNIAKEGKVPSLRITADKKLKNKVAARKVLDFPHLNID